MSKSAKQSYFGWTHVKGGSNYKYVVKLTDPTGDEHWLIKIPNVSSKEYPTEREAAIAVDLFLINKGKEPVNILKRK